MATAVETRDHEEIRRWVESKDGRPAIVEGTGGVLRIDFGQPEERLEPISWDQFFDIFDENNLAFLYDPKGYMVKFVSAESTSGRGRKKSSSSNGRKKSTSSRGRKKSTSSRSGGRKKSSTSGGRKKSSTSSGRKKSRSAGARKKSTSSSGGRKKSGSTRGGKKSTSSSSGGRKKSSSTRGRKKSSSSSGAGKKSRKKSSGRKYGKKAGRKVERAMHEMKRGELKSGGSGKKVKNPKQAIAIGLSEARRSGGKVPPNPNRRKSRKK